MKATLIAMQRETDNLRKIIERLLQVRTLMERLQSISVDRVTDLTQQEWRESLRNTPHRKVNSPCKSCTSVVWQRWSVIVEV